MDITSVNGKDYTILFTFDVIDGYIVDNDGVYTIVFDRDGVNYFPDADEIYNLVARLQDVSGQLFPFTKTAKEITCLLSC